MSIRVTSELIAAYTRTLTLDNVDSETCDMASRFVLDSLGCCLGAFAAEPIERLRRTYGDRTADTGATVLGTDRRVAPEYAALINSAMVRYFDFNDCYLSGDSVCHPSDHVPGLLAVAEDESATGAEFLESLVVAYELECRGVDTGLVWEQGFDYVTWGALSATAAIGKLMGLSHSQLVNAIGIAVSSSNTLLISRLGDLSMWKGLAHPYVVHNAVQACQMARTGVTGPSAVIEGPCGFEEAVARADVRFEDLGGRDDAPFRLPRTNIKPYACGYFMMAPIAGLLDILESTDNVSPDEIDEIEVRTFEQAAQVLSGPEKRRRDLTRETADHSLPYTLAVTAVDHEVTPRQYAPDRLSDDRVHEVKERVAVAVDDELSAYRRDHPGEIPHVIRVTIDDETHERRVDTPPGHFRNRLSDDALEAKVRDLAQPYLPNQVNELIAACRDLEGHDDVADLLDVTQV